MGIGSSLGNRASVRIRDDGHITAVYASPRVLCGRRRCERLFVRNDRSFMPYVFRVIFMNMGELKKFHTCDMT